MNLFELLVNVQGFLLFAQFFLFVNHNNPVRHLFVAMYGYMFYLYLMMDKQCVVPYMEPRNYTHGEFI